MGESLQQERQERESPWAITLTDPVQEAFEFSPSDWPVLANQRRGTPGRLSCLLTRGCFPHQSS